jgi:hypothetical protein
MKFIRVVAFVSCGISSLWQSAFPPFTASLAKTIVGGVATAVAMPTEW